MKITYYNPGIMSMEYVTVFGLSDKPNKDSIGMFGTGLKYAIAITLRVGGMIRIITQSDIKHEYIFSRVTKETARGTEYTAVLMDTYTNNERTDTQTLPFTTDLGKGWKTWMVHRELGANALDENGDWTFYSNIEALPLTHDEIVNVCGEEYTRVDVIIPALLDEEKIVRNVFWKDAMHNTGQLLVHTNIQSVDTTKIYEKSDRSIGGFYCAGVLVYPDNVNEDVQDQMEKVVIHSTMPIRQDELTEERMLKNKALTLYRRISAYDTEVLCLKEEFIPHMSSPKETNMFCVPELMNEVVKNNNYTPMGTGELATYVRQQRAEKENVARELSSEQQELLFAGLRVMEYIGLPYSKDVAFKTKDLTNSGVLAYTHEKDVIICESIFDEVGFLKNGSEYQNVKDNVMAVLLEEYTHAVLDTHDRTLSQQHAYIHMMLTIYKTLKGDL